MKVKRFLSISEEFDNIAIMRKYPYSNMLPQIICHAVCPENISKNIQSEDIREIEITDFLGGHNVTITI